VIPALIHGTDPVGLSEVGLMTSPVHVLDLSIVLPALALSESSLLRKKTLGYLLTPLLLGFSALMSLAIGGMIAMYLDGLPVALGVAGGMSCHFRSQSSTVS